MKRVSPVLLLALIFGGTYLLANPGKLSLIISPGLTRKDVIIELKTLYTECQHGEGTEAHYPPKKWAQVLEELSQAGWMITSFTTDQVAVEKKTAGLCSQCRDQEFIGIYGREIGVYAGSPDQPGPLKQVIPVDIGRLPLAEIEDLKAGIICTQAQDKWRILEGYQN